MLKFVHGHARLRSFQPVLFSPTVGPNMHNEGLLSAKDLHLIIASWIP